MGVHREITPLKENDCFLVLDRKLKKFNFPIHFHPEYEINFIRNAKGAKRIVGDHIGEIEEYELVMLGPNVYHGWENYKNDTTQVLHEITIQFPRYLFNSQVLNKNIFKPIKELFKNANQGILFSDETARNVESKLKLISIKSGFDNFLDFQSLLYDLAISRNKKMLTNISFEDQNDFHNSKRIEKVYNYIKENYDQKIKVENAASVINMTVISFSRLIKQRTGKTFIEFVNDLRLSFATRKLIETNESISEICFSCGFNNISNFNRIFKKKKNCTPSEFRQNFIGTRNFF
ncbi:AraC family transcriptional regulator [uncultured Aquimarina sp.]|uniref:AraC family transcriptional regulator n=1 Tax=uncultured Aquimarina sp. TaxID=575652 RepID=UPI002604AC6F|nr:AraC family transcriptional regulator [uncultured Aquimarina sp.]